MKTIQKTLLLLMISMSLMACGQEAKQKNDNTKRPSKTFGKGASVVEKIRDQNKEVTALKSLEPITVEELEKWLPQTIKGMNKVKGGALAQDGIVGVNASYLSKHPEYGKDYGKTLDILIIDGHGERGATASRSFVSIKYDNLNSENSDGYTKTITHESTVVKEEFDSHNNTYTLSFFYNNRFGVEMKLKGFEQKELWSVFKEINLEKLSN